MAASRAPPHLRVEMRWRRREGIGRPSHGSDLLAPARRTTSGGHVRMDPRLGRRRDPRPRPARGRRPVDDRRWPRDGRERPAHFGRRRRRDIASRHGTLAADGSPRPPPRQATGGVSITGDPAPCSMGSDAAFVVDAPRRPLDGRKPTRVRSTYYLPCDVRGRRERISSSYVSVVLGSSISCSAQDGAGTAQEHLPASPRRVVPNVGRARACSARTSTAQCERTMGPSVVRLGDSGSHSELLPQ